MTIAVIGHGRSPEGRHWGGIIDACTTVVRMWDYTWQPTRDYGERYDHGLFVLTPKGLRVFTEHVSGVPRRSWLAYVGKPTSGPLPQGAPVILIDPSPWVEKASTLGGVGMSGRLTLTRGTVAAAWAIGKARREPVVLVGFDNVLLGTNQPIEQSFCPAYWGMYMSRFAPDVQKVYPVGQPKTATHDMAVERRLLLQLAREQGVDLKFAQEVW